MNEQQRLYLVQARSEWGIFQLLKRQAVCHRLHYLQMVTDWSSKFSPISNDCFSAA